MLEDQTLSHWSSQIITLVARGLGLAPIRHDSITSGLPREHVIRRLDAMPAWQRRELTGDLVWDGVASRLRAISSRRLRTLRDQAFVSVEATATGCEVRTCQKPNRLDASMAVAAYVVTATLAAISVADVSRFGPELMGFCVIRVLVSSGRRIDAARFAAVLTAACDARIELPPPVRLQTQPPRHEIRGRP